MTANEKLEKLKKIVLTHQCAKIEKTLVDATTANAILTVYEKLNEKNKEVFLSKNIITMANVAYKLLT